MSGADIDFWHPQVVSPVTNSGPVPVYRFERLVESAPHLSKLGARVAGAINWEALEPSHVSAEPLTMSGGDIYTFQLRLPTGGRLLAHFSRVKRAFRAEGQPEEQLRFLKRFLSSKATVSGLKAADRKAMVAALSRALKNEVPRLGLRRR